MQKLVEEKMKDIVVERKKGKWIKVDTNTYTCSNCNHCFEIVPEVNHIQQFKYCPNCKIEMEVEE
jgi:peptide subunit release factor 1 (eRF1)